MAYLYVRVYLGIRKSRISEISHVTNLVKMKLESKAAKTTVLPTTAVIFSISAAMVFYVLGEVFPSIHSVVNFRLWEAPIMLYSLANPILYCYRDRRFRNAAQELLRIRKPRSTVRAEGKVQYARRKYPIDEAEDVLKLQNVDKPVVRLLKRATSCDLAMVPECVHGISHKITMKRSLSAPTLGQCNTSSEGLQLQKHSAILITIAAAIHNKYNDELQNNKACSEGSVKPAVRPNRRSNSWNASSSVQFANRSPIAEDMISRRTKSLPLKASRSACLRNNLNSIRFLLMKF